MEEHGDRHIEAIKSFVRFHFSRLSTRFFSRFYFLNFFEKGEMEARYIIMRNAR